MRPAFLPNINRPWLDLATLLSVEPACDHREDIEDHRMEDYAGVTGGSNANPSASGALHGTEGGGSKGRGGVRGLL